MTVSSQLEATKQILLTSPYERQRTDTDTSSTPTAVHSTQRQELESKSSRQTQAVMSGQHSLDAESEENVVSPSATTSFLTTEPKISGTESRLGLENQNEEDEKMQKDEAKEFKEEEEEEMTVSALLEPSTLPWPAEKEWRLEATENGGAPMSEEAVAEEEEGAKEVSGGSQDLSEGQSQPESDRKTKAKWRESMPEGERWRDEGDGSLADDEEEDEKEVNWMPEKAALVFTPQVNIVHLSSKEIPQESTYTAEQDPGKEPLTEPSTAVQYYPEWTEGDDNYIYLCDSVCSDKLKLGLGVAAAAVIFPLLVWGGYALLPFDAPLLESAPLRLVYTLRCSFFAVVPILLGVVVQGVARLRYGALSPLYEGKTENRLVAVHWHYVNESLALFLFYFLLLAVMATYMSQDLLKLVPVLTIIFAFGRLIYWLCLALGSSVRGLGFGLSFFPILVMLGVNLYYICSSLGQEAIFDVAPPTTAPPPAPRWWG